MMFTQAKTGIRWEEEKKPSSFGGKTHLWEKLFPKRGFFFSSFFRGHFFEASSSWCRMSFASLWLFLDLGWHFVMANRKDIIFKETLETIHTWPLPYPEYKLANKAVFGTFCNLHSWRLFSYRSILSLFGIQALTPHGEKTGPFFHASLQNALFPHVLKGHFNESICPPSFILRSLFVVVQRLFSAHTTTLSVPGAI